MLRYTVLLIFFLLSLSASQAAVQCGNRPTSLINAESQCESEVKTGIVQQVQQKARSLFDRAKQELGMKVETTAEPKQCEYYYCIFEKLGMLNQLDLPDLSLIKSWIDTEIDVANRSDLYNQVTNCFRLLATSALNIQNTCETTLHLMKCMHSSDKCETFKFP